MLNRCAPCGGVGRVLHMGGQTRECKHCFGTGNVTLVEDEIAYLERETIKPVELPAHKRTVKYSEAREKLRKKLRTKDYEPTNEHLEQLLDKAMGKK